MKMIGIVLVILGTLALVYGGFTYVRETQNVDLGVAEVEVQDREHVEIPVWLGAGLSVGGVVLIAVSGRGKRQLTS